MYVRRCITLQNCYSAFSTFWTNPHFASHLQIKEDRFRNLFAAFGTLTDVSLKFTKDGKFRKFGFIGFRSEDEAKAALAHFHKSFIDTARVTVSVL